VATPTDAQAGWNWAFWERVLWLGPHDAHVYRFAI
jgi:hypothetical protein